MNHSNPERNAVETTWLDENQIPYQHLRLAVKAIESISDKFDVNPSSVRAIPLAYGVGNTELAVVYTGTGIALGSWDDIVNAPDTDYTIDIGGATMDSRCGMTFSVYQAMYRVLNAESKAQGRPCMPDSLPKDDPRYEPRTWTWLTGENPTANSPLAPIGTVRLDGQHTEVELRNRGGNFEAICFRPAIVIGDEAAAIFESLHPDKDI